MVVGECLSLKTGNYVEVWGYWDIEGFYNEVNDEDRSLMI